MVEPLVWLPSASGTIAAATAAAEPLEEPPGVCSGLCGLRVLPGVKYAHSVVTVLPIITAPAARNWRTTAASCRGVRPWCSSVPFSVGMSAVSMMSLMPTGMPFSVPTGWPLRRRSPAAWACLSACASSRKCQACTAGSTWRMRSRQDCTSSSAVRSPSRIRRDASAALSAAGCSSPIHYAGQPETDPREDVEQYHRKDLDRHERHHARKYLIERHMGWRHALQIERRHRHRRRQEGGLQVERHEQAKEQRIDAEVRQERDKDRHEDDDDFGPLERPAQDEDDELGEDHELHRGHLQRHPPFLDDLLSAEQCEGRRENRRADEQPAHHGARLRGEERRLLDDAAELAQRPRYRRAPGGSGCRAPVLDEAVSGREDQAAQRTDGGRLGGRGETKYDRAEHEQDQDGEREERGQEVLEDLEPPPGPQPIKSREQERADRHRDPEPRRYGKTLLDLRGRRFSLSFGGVARALLTLGARLFGVRLRCGGGRFRGRLGQAGAGVLRRRGEVGRFLRLGDVAARAELLQARGVLHHLRRRRRAISED